MTDLNKFQKMSLLNNIDQEIWAKFILDISAKKISISEAHKDFVKTHGINITIDTFIDRIDLNNTKKWGNQKHSPEFIKQIYDMHTIQKLSYEQIAKVFHRNRSHFTGGMVAGIIHRYKKKHQI